MRRVRGAGWLILAAAVSAAAPPGGIDREIEGLGSDDYETRERASAVLREAGERAEEALLRAARSPDPEVRARAAAILACLRYGLVPGAPQELGALVEGYRRGGEAEKRQAVRAIEDLGEAGERALVSLCEEEPDDAVREALFLVPLGRLRRRAGARIAGGEEGWGGRVLEQAVRAGDRGAGPGLAAFHRSRGTLAAKIAECERIAGSGQGTAAFRVLAVLRRGAGDLAGAAVAAEESGDSAVLEEILLESGDWARLADRVGVPPRGAETAEALGFAAAVHRLAGGREIADEILERLVERGVRGPGEPRGFAAACLANDRPEDAIRILLDRGDPSGALEVLRAQARYEEAFEIALGSAAAPGPGGPGLRFALAALLLDVGEEARARGIADPLPVSRTAAAGPQKGAGDPAAEARGLERALLGRLRIRAASLSPGECVSLTAALHRARARERLAAGDPEGARVEAEYAVRLLPADPAVAAELGPALARQGRPAIADALASRIERRLSALCGKYPRAAALRSDLERVRRAGLPAPGG